MMDRIKGRCLGPWNTCWEGRTNDLPNEPIPLMIRPRKYNFDDNDVEVIMNIYHSGCVNVKKSQNYLHFRCCEANINEDDERAV